MQKKIKRWVLLSLFIPSVLFAGQLKVLNPFMSVAGFGTAIFVWECDNVDVTVTGYSAGDDSATANDQATIAAGWCVFDDTVDSDGHDWYQFTVSGNDIWHETEMTVFVKFEITTRDNQEDIELFSIFQDTDDYVTIFLTSAGDIDARHYSSTTPQTNQVGLSTDPIGTGTEYIVRLRYRVDAGDDLEITLFDNTPDEYDTDDDIETDAADTDQIEVFGVKPGADDFKVGNRRTTEQDTNFKIDYVHVYPEWRDNDPNDGL